MSEMVLKALVAGVFVGYVLGRVHEWWGRRHELAELRDLDELRVALWIWALEYMRAKPTGKYLKLREAKLYAACTKLGIDNITARYPWAGLGAVHLRRQLAKPDPK